MSVVLTVSLQNVKDAMQRQWQDAPQPWEENARRWLHVEDMPPTHTVGEADMGKLVVLEGAECWVCVGVDKAGLEWIVVTASRLRRQPSRGGDCYKDLKNVSGAWASCAGHTGAQPGASRGRRSCSWG